MKLKYYLRGMGMGMVLSTLILSIALAFAPSKISDDEVIRRAKGLGMTEGQTTADLGALDNKPAYAEAEQVKSIAEKNAEDALERKQEAKEQAAEEIKKAQEEKQAQKQDETTVDKATEKNTETKTVETKTENKTENKPVEAKTQEKTEAKTDNSKIDSKVDAKSSGEVVKTDTNGSKDSYVISSVETVPFTIEKGQLSNTVVKNLYNAGIISNEKEFNQYLDGNGYDSKIQSGTFYIEKGLSYKQLAELLVTSQKKRSTSLKKTN